MPNTYLETRLRLAFLWVFVNLNTFARDMHELGREGMLEQMLTGTINGVKITEELMLIGGFMSEVSILMILLSLMLARSINRWVTIVGAVLTFFLLVNLNINPDLDNTFFLAVQTIALVAIIRIAWRWRSASSTV